ncbi:hypothetical protein GFK82_00651 [Candidatus Steffania adelgidicola]|nr:hypothetical protein GFK82_00651 [Candidatus Steffania adelgidicola]
MAKWNILNDVRSYGKVLAFLDYGGCYPQLDYCLETHQTPVGST